MQPFKYNPNNHTGLFRHRITFQQLDTNEDELGQQDKSDEKWKDVSKAWAMIKTLQGREYFAAGTPKGEVKSRFIIPYQEGIDGTMRILYNNRVFTIEEPPINDDEMYKTLTLIVKEVRAGG